MAARKLKWTKVAGKMGKWALLTALAGLGTAAGQGADIGDPAVAGQVALTAVVAGLLGGAQNAWKHRGPQPLP